MKFLSINDNVSVNKEEIIAVERMESGNARIVLESVSYETSFPYQTILQLLEVPDIEEKVSQQMNTVSQVGRMQYWAG